MVAYSKGNGGNDNPPPAPDPDPKPTGDVRYRGIGIDQNAISAADMTRMAGWGVNHVRWIFENWTDVSNQTAEEYLDWIRTECDKLEALLPLLKTLGVTVNLAIHRPPRGSNSGGVMRVFLDTELEAAFVDGWKIIAERFKDNNTIVYYDLLNEPNDGNRGALGYKDWRTLAIETANAINAIDDTKTFIFEPVNDEYRELDPLPVSNMIYSVHMYTPHLLTHQGVGISWEPKAYPGTFAVGSVYNWKTAPRNWNKAVLRRFLDEVCGVIDFAKTNEVEIYVGEFGCARWAPNHSAYEYIKDCLDIFEEEGWHWVYFKDGGYPTTNYAANTWSLEYDETFNSGTPVSAPTDRLQLLQSYWAKNSD